QADVKVEIVTRVGAQDELLVQLAAGTADDIIMSNYNAVPMAGFMTDLTPYLERSGIQESDFAPGFLDTISGTFYAAPLWATDPQLIYYNVEMFDEAGLITPFAHFKSGDWTPETAFDLARSLSRDRDGDGTNDQWGFAFRSEWSW